MKTFLFKYTLLAICLIGFAIKISAITITAYGNYSIYDPGSSATYNGYAYIEVKDNSPPFYPCTNPGNPFAQNVYAGGPYSSGSLDFANVTVPNPEPMYPYRVVLIAIRSTDSEQRRAYSNWAGQYGLQPWTPNPIILDFS